jgi:hypothetical protein
MRRLPDAPAATLLLAFLAACGDSTGVEVEDLVGTWDVQVFEFTSVGPPPITIDLIELGGSGTFVISDDGDFVVTITFAGETDVNTGRLQVNGDRVTIIDGSDQATGTISRSGDTLTIHLTEGVEFDVDDDGVDDDARLRLVLRKR